MGRRGGPQAEQICVSGTDVGRVSFFFFVNLQLKLEHSGLRANIAAFKGKRQRGRAGVPLLQIKRLL